MAFTFSIIIPTFNRCDALARTLESLSKVNTKAADFEVLIINNGSADLTSPMVERFCSDVSRQQWRLLTEPMPGLLSARHRGALESSGDVCLFIDDDVRLDPQWFDAFHEAFKDPSVVMAGGPSRSLFEVEPAAWLKDFQEVGEAGEVCIPLSLFNGGDRTKEIDPLYIFGLNFGIRRETLFIQGGFHPDCLPRPLQRYQGDGETGLSLKIKQSGLKAIYHPQASVEHEIPASRLTEKYFIERFFYQGVCDSYTQIRSDGGVRIENARARDPLGWVKEIFLGWFLPKKRSGYVSKMAKAYRQGFEFHQKEVRQDSSLLNWVLRPNYWDYRLPAGWQRYLSRTT